MRAVADRKGVGYRQGMERSEGHALQKARHLLHVQKREIEALRNVLAATKSALLACRPQNAADKRLRLHALGLVSDIEATRSTTAIDVEAATDPQQLAAADEKVRAFALSVMEQIEAGGDLGQLLDAIEGAGLRELVMTHVGEEWVRRAAEQAAAETDLAVH